MWRLGSEEAAVDTDGDVLGSVVWRGITAILVPSKVGKYEVIRTTDPRRVVVAIPEENVYRRLAGVDGFDEMIAAVKPEFEYAVELLARAGLDEAGPGD